MAFLLGWSSAVAIGAGTTAIAVVMGGRMLATRTGNRAREPNHAPGPSDADMQQERRRRRVSLDLEAAQRARNYHDADEGTAEGTELQDAQRRLKEIEESNRKKEEDRRNYPVPDFLKNALCSGRVNIAITGSSGSGKSSFINFIRKVKTKDPDFAKFGVTECTRDATCYRAASGDYLWDLPGVGTQSFPQESYIQSMGIRYFDVVCLITADRFMEAECMLKRELEEFKVPHVCIRNKSDVAWQSKITEEKESLEESDDEDSSKELSKEREMQLKEEVIQEMKDRFKQDYGMEDVHFIASVNAYRDSFDFEKLQGALDRAVENARVSQHCPICFELYGDFGGPEEHVRHVAHCGHSWCNQCHDQLSLCPICRQTMDANE